MSIIGRLFNFRRFADSAAEGYIAVGSGQGLVWESKENVLNMLGAEITWGTYDEVGTFQPVSIQIVDANDDPVTERCAITMFTKAGLAWAGVSQMVLTPAVGSDAAISPENQSAVILTDETGLAEFEIISMLPEELEFTLFLGLPSGNVVESDPKDIPAGPAPG